MKKASRRSLGCLKLLGFAFSVAFREDWAGCRRRRADARARLQIVAAVQLVSYAHAFKSPVAASFSIFMSRPTTTASDDGGAGATCRASSNQVESDSLVCWMRAARAARAPFFRAPPQTPGQRDDRAESAFGLFVVRARVARRARNCTLLTSPTLFFLFRSFLFFSPPLNCT